MPPRITGMLGGVGLRRTLMVMKQGRLTPERRAQALSKQGALSGWSEVKGRDAVERTFTFKNFNEAWGFMSRTALLAEKMDHHPEWSNVYNRVHVLLTTHDVGGVSEQDVELGKQMTALAANNGAARGASTRNGEEDDDD